MKHKALVRRLQISCLGLDPVDPLRLLVDDVIEALTEHAMREVQRLGQEIEQEPVMWVSEDVCEGQLINGRPRKIWWECDKGVGTAFYTHPPQRTWVGLTESERRLINFQWQDGNGTAPEIIDLVEARLKEKNT